MARRVDPRRLRRANPPDPTGTADPIAQLASQLPPHGQVAQSAPEGPSLPSIDLRSPLERSAHRLGAWGSVLTVIGIAGGVVSVVAGIAVAANGNDDFGIGVVAGGVTGVLIWSWFSAFSQAAAEALMSTDRALTLLETRTDLLRQLAQRQVGPARPGPDSS